MATTWPYTGGKTLQGKRGYSASHRAEAGIPTWGTIVGRRVAQMHTLAEAGDTATADLLRMELDGGACPKCGDPWREVTFENAFAKGRYFRPACDCFIRCPRCERDLYEEDSAGLLQAHDWRCPYCGYRVWGYEGKTETTTQRHGREWERRYGRMTRWQQHEDGGGVRMSKEAADEHE